MLQKLNERIQGVVAWLVVILIGITFTLFGVDYYFQSRQTNNAKVMINGNPLSLRDFDTNYRRSRAMHDTAQMTAFDEKKLQNEVLDQMISNEVLVQAANKNGFEVTPNQANSAILSIPQFQEDGRFSLEKYQQALNAALFTQSSFLNEVKQGMLLNQQRFAFMGSSFALPEEINQFVRLYMQNRDYDYLIVKASSFENKIQVSLQDQLKYYNKHKKNFMFPEQVSVDYVILSMADIKAKIKVSDEAIKHYYEENQNNFLTPASWKVSHILFALAQDASQTDINETEKKAHEVYQALQVNPEQFNKFVETRSDDKLSIPNNGLLPWITAGQSDYNKFLVNLTTPGTISSPQKTKHGYEIFKLIDYKPVSIKPLSEVKDSIKEQIVSDRVQAEYTKNLEQLSDLSYQSPDSLKPVADLLKLNIKTTQPFSRSGGNESITTNKQIVNGAFSNDVLNLGNNSEPIQINNDSVAVIRVNRHLPEKIQSFDEVKNKINQILVKKIAENKAKEIGIKILNTSDEKKQEELINSNHLMWKSVLNSARDNDKENSEINELAFNLSGPGSSSGSALLNGDYILVTLKQINYGKFSNIDREQQDSLIQQIEANFGTMEYDLYVKNLVNQAKIEKIIKD